MKNPGISFECLECDEKETAKATDNTCVPKIEGCRKHKSDGTCEDCGDIVSKDLRTAKIVMSKKKAITLKNGCQKYCDLNNAVTTGSHKCGQIPEPLMPDLNECAKGDKLIAFDKDDKKVRCIDKISISSYNVMLMKGLDMSASDMVCFQTQDGKEVSCKDDIYNNNSRDFFKKYEIARCPNGQPHKALIYVAWDGSLIENDNRAGAFILYIARTPKNPPK
ncbi:hypothetical protein O9G_002499 [Rozella allomycis CSF55]|uniref:Uncharacterized protein n=1 Tax=Rozella allomycis (strain CSF55) TaxID=988480 RepID=A0A075AUG0_ROZAC|nr:hypothetical protein O9G_002499 [Rozella allomycis CSF55]|eukprot:EPZ33936.1 hypothetical protein O9G_002499 [Rozella allomycis CSF55]